MHVAVAVGGLHYIAESIGQILVLLGAAGLAGAGIGMLDRRENVVAVDAAATGGGHAVEVAGLLIGAARLVGLHVGHIVVAIIIVIGADIALGRLGLAGVILDGLGQPSQIVVAVVRINAHRIMDLDIGTEGPVIVSIRADQQHRRGGRHGARACPGRAAVGAGIDGCNQMVSIIGKHKRKIMSFK